jgi:hypothetical protein
MKFLLAVGGLFCVGFLLNSTASAQTITISGGTTTTAESLTKNGGSVNVTSTGTLNVGSGNAAISFSDKTDGDSLSVTNSGTIEQTGSGNNGSEALVDTKGHLTITVTNNAGATIQTTNGETLDFNQASNTVTVNNSGTITS